MKSLCLALTLCLATGVFQNVSAEETNVKTSSEKKAKIHYSLDSDSREWKLQNKTDNNLMTIYQYTPDGEKLETTKELLTLFYMKDYNNSKKEYFDLFIKELQSRVPKNKVSSKILKEDKKMLFAEWWIDDNSSNDVHEWLKIFSKGNKMAIIKYSTTLKNNLDELRRKWEDIIGNATYN